MKMSKILININNLNELEEYRKIGITNFLFAINEFSIGYKTFSLDEIPKEGYLLINRVMDTKTINDLRLLKNEIVKFKGIVYEDLGVYHIFKDTGIELIHHQVHFATNSSVINYWLEKDKSIVLSNELTKEEIEEIVNKVNKPVVINMLGKNNIMYSRRTLLSNFNNYQGLEENREMILHEPISNNNFRAIENEYGTYFVNDEYFNYFGKLNIDDNNVLFYLIYNRNLTPNEINEIINGKKFGNDGFLFKKTVYQLKDYRDREAL